MDKLRIRVAPTPWNKGKLVGQKAPLKLKEIWAIRVRLQVYRRTRELALFDLGIDSKLRAGSIENGEYHSAHVGPWRQVRANCGRLNSAHRTGQINPWRLFRSPLRTGGEREKAVVGWEGGRARNGHSLKAL